MKTIEATKLTIYLPKTTKAKLQRQAIQQKVSVSKLILGLLSGNEKKEPNRLLKYFTMGNPETVLELEAQIELNKKDFRSKKDLDIF